MAYALQLHFQKVLLVQVANHLPRRMNMISLSDSAVQAVSRFINSAETPITGLRISVAGGGCSGFQYSMRLEEEPAMEDTVVNCGEVKVFIDPASAPFLENVSVDFVDNIEGSGFKFHNPNAKASCGCGNSFSA
jgi:iron-sulfur cluster assembly protein